MGTHSPWVSRLIKQIAKTATEHYPQTKLLKQIPGVGPLTSLSFVLAVGEPERFADPRDVGAYLGLVPRRDQSGDTEKQLPISKAGNRDMRRLLVQCAQYILGRFGSDCDLRRHGLKLAVRGGKSAKRKAVIAVARKLAVLMLVLWKIGRPYESRKPKHRQKTKRPKSAKHFSPMNNRKRLFRGDCDCSAASQNAKRR